MSGMKLWWRWVLSTVAGFLFGIPLAVPGIVVVGFVFMYPISLYYNARGIGGQGAGLGTIFGGGALGAGFTFGAILGLAQWWLALRRISPPVRWWGWVLTSALGWMGVIFAFIVVMFLPFYLGSVQAWDGSTSQRTLLSFH